MDPIPKIVPMFISIDESAPSAVFCDELKLFRAALNFLSTACHRTRTGFVSLKISYVGSQLLFECEDTAANVSDRDTQVLFGKENERDTGEISLRGLSFAARIVSSMGGHCGFKQREGSPSLQARSDHGSVFHFSVPVTLPPPKWTDTANSVDAHSVGGQKRESELSDASETCTLPRIGSFSSNTSSSIMGDDSFHKTQSWNSGTSTVQKVSGSSRVFSAMAGASGLKAAQKLSLDNALTGHLAMPDRTSARTDLWPVLGHETKTDKQSMETGPIPHDVADKSRQRKALVVDDSLVVRKSLGRALSDMGYEVTLAQDGMEGLRELKATLFDLCLCDFLMPVMDGLDCVKQYRAWEVSTRPWFRQCIVGISAHASENDLARGLEAGMDDYRSKPISAKVLQEIDESVAVKKLAQHLDNTRARLVDGAVSLDGNMSDASKNPISERAWYLTRQPSDLIPARSKRSREDDLMKEAAASASPKKKTVSFCLVATGLPEENDVVGLLENNGWQCEIARTSDEAFKFLKMRNWDAVLVDSDLPPSSGTGCISEFRAWETENRINRQNNVFLQCSRNTAGFCKIPVLVQAPTGFDGALQKPFLFNDFQDLLKQRSGQCLAPMSIITS